MATSKPITWLITDIIQWYKSGELVVNDSFQRHSVWSPQAKTLLIDTILNELPMPKIFIRTKIDTKKQKTIKEIVDGQQRIRSIVEFANDEFTLNKKSELYSGKKCSELDEEVLQRFLGYVITAEQLLNASDDDVIDIFARLNSYTVSLNAAEKRHAAFQTELKFFVRRMSVKFRWFIEKYGVFSIKQRFRMFDDEFFAELTRLILHGVCDGGSNRTTKFYSDTPDEKFTEIIQIRVEGLINEVITYLDQEVGVMLKGGLGKHYQLYSIASAYLYIKNLIPRIESIPSPDAFKGKDETISGLLVLESMLDDDNNTTDYCKASRSTTQRLTHRISRLKAYIDAISE